MKMLSNIRSPTNFDQDENKEQEEEQDFQGEMNEVTISVNKKGTTKFMVVQAIVTQNFEVAGLSFAESYEEVKKNRGDIYGSNRYTGPEVDSLSEELLEGIYTFLEQECEVTEDLLQKFGDYCIDAEQSFYINWLKDLKSVV